MYIAGVHSNQCSSIAFFYFLLAIFSFFDIWYTFCLGLKLLVEVCFFFSHQMVGYKWLLFNSLVKLPAIYFTFSMCYLLCLWLMTKKRQSPFFPSSLFLSTQVNHYSITSQISLSTLHCSNSWKLCIPFYV